MKSKRNQHYTYIKETLSYTQQQYVDAHMDEIGMNPTAEPSVFEVPPLHHYIHAHSDILNVRSSLPMHSHTFMEVIYYISGSNIECIAGLHRYRLQKGDIVCMPPGISHRVLLPDPNSEPCKRHLISFTPKLGGNIYGTYDKYGIGNQNTPFILRTAGTEWEKLSVLFEVCLRELEQKDPYWQQIMASCIHILLVELTRAYLKDMSVSIKAEKAGLFEALLAYVEDNLKNKITLSETAQHFYISERTITREFQKNLDISFYRYVTQRRLDNAKNLLMNNISIESICEMVGFSDYPTFYRAFKKEYGISPRQMKKMEQSKNTE